MVERINRRQPSDASKAVFERMRTEGITFEKEVETLCLPVGRGDYGYYSSTNGITVRTWRMGDHLLRMERTWSFFVDFRKLPFPSVVVLPLEIGRSPVTLQECRERFKILSEQKRGDGEYVYVVCKREGNPNLRFLFRNGMIVGLYYGMLAHETPLYTDEGLWELLRWLNLIPQL
jgi:hypothetical protein